MTGHMAGSKEMSQLGAWQPLIPGSLSSGLAGGKQGRPEAWQCPSFRAASPAAWLLRVQTADFFATASDAQQAVLRPGVAGKRELGGLFSASLAVNSRITSALSSDLSSMRVGLRCSIGSAKREATCQAAQAAQEHPQVGRDLSAAHRSDRRLARQATQVALLSAAVPAPSPCPHPGLTPGQNTA